MSGVNNSKDYIYLMGFGHTEGPNNSPVVDNTILQGGIVSIYYLGTLIGALGGGWFGDKVGRVKAIAAGAAWAIFGAALQCSAQNKEWMICGKLQTCHRASIRLSCDTNVISALSSFD